SEFYRTPSGFGAPLCKPPIIIARFRYHDIVHGLHFLPINYHIIFRFIYDDIVYFHSNQTSAG
ncbi:MAG: hypothetical protein J6L84_00530, partial [Clostridiales bacterium]|nr:hypothetical protein [Clostridiales bacterium]